MGLRVMDDGNPPFKAVPQSADRSVKGREEDSPPCLPCNMYGSFYFAPRHFQRTLVADMIIWLTGRRFDYLAYGSPRSVPRPDSWRREQSRRATDTENGLNSGILREQKCPNCPRLRAKSRHVCHHRLCARRQRGAGRNE